MPPEVSLIAIVGREGITNQLLYENTIRVENSDCNTWAIYILYITDK